MIEPLPLDSPIILVFGATGRTGKYFVDHALSKGFIVRAIVRDPSKLPEEKRFNKNIQIIKGSITDESILEEALADGKVQYIASMIMDTTNKDLFMTKLIKYLVPLMKKYMVKRIVYQAGEFSPRPNESLSWTLSALRTFFGYTMGTSQLLVDNDTVIHYLSKEANDIEWVVTRPAIIVEKPSRGIVKRNSKTSSTLTYTDLALHNLKMLQDPDAVHSIDCCSYQTY